ncbi:hypothetical protein ACWF9G_24545 [Nocardia sp. NPDC055029]|uniref:hypothetical protein n=1 Tax=Nocardia sp. NPDC060259 TaxID=3347088 RepID=UPI00364F8FAA
MIDMLALRPVASEQADHDAHEQLAQAVADRNPTAAAEFSRAHLSALKEAFA